MRFTDANVQGCFVFLVHVILFCITRLLKKGTPFDIDEAKTIPGTSAAAEERTFGQHTHVDDSYEYPAALVPSDSYSIYIL